MRAFKAGVLVCVFLAFPATMLGQTASSAVVLGTVTDATQAVVPGAEVTLTDLGTNLARSTETNAAGYYIFVNVMPGFYKVTVTAQGFRQATVPSLKVEVAKSYSLNFSLEVGAVTETVEVQATTAAELQTTDSTVGNVITKNQLGKIPTVTRLANEILMNQPLVTPFGEVAGARSDQSTFALDGIDITNQSVGGTGTYTRMPVDSLEEFRVSVANPNASFGRGAGGQVSAVTRRGANDYHGFASWYHQNDNLNATRWESNRTLGFIGGVPISDPTVRKKRQKPEEKDNRFNFAASGPIVKQKTFFFAMYEGRRRPGNASDDRLVPLGINDPPVGVPKLREGVLRFRDGTGAVVSYNMATSTLCGSAGTTACDPRGLGLSPAISGVWSFLPAPNNFSLGDGFNTAGFSFIAKVPLEDNFYRARIDHNFTDKWQVNAVMTYYGFVQTTGATGGVNQFSIINGDVQAPRTSDDRQHNLTANLTGQFSPTLTGRFDVGYVRVKPSVSPIRPDAAASALAIPGTATAGGTFVGLDLGALGGTQSLLGEPIDLNTQVARKQDNDNRIYQYNAELTWVRGRHTWNFGTRLRNLHTLHRRDDKVLGALGALVAQLDSEVGGVIRVPATHRPPTCGGAVTTNCLLSADVQQWSRLLSSTLGLIDNISVLMVRDGAFNPLPFGDLLVSDTKLWATEFYFQDSWRMTSSFTLTYGLNYGWQLPPTEKLGRYSIMCSIDASTGNCDEFLGARSFLLAREAAARGARIFNPQFGFAPVDFSGRSGVFDIDWNNIAPRLAMAWNPSFTGGFLAKLFGDRKTVIRGGYGLVFDRQNTVQSVIVPSLGVAFAQTINVNGPQCNSTGAGGVGCTPGDADPLLSIFRVGRDGAVPAPVIPVQGIPVSPFWGPTTPCPLPGPPPSPCPSSSIRRFPEVLSFQVDPFIKVGENHSMDLTWQRELPGNVLLEIGYAGRIARNLPQSMNFGQVPYMFPETTSGQTFAQAYDNVALALRAGTPAASLGAQPWFEAFIPSLSCVVSGVPTTCTRWVAATNGSSFVNGNINSLWASIDLARMQNGLTPFNNYMAQTLFLRSSTGRSNYHALFVSAQKRLSHGLTFQANYTWAKSLDQLGAIQNAASVMPNNFDLNAEYGPSPFNITHILNTNWTYDLPFKPASGLMRKLAGGWYVAGSFEVRSGDALCVAQGSQVWGGSLFLGFTSCAIPLVDPDTFSSDVQNPVIPTGVIGQNSNPNPPVNGTGLNMFSDPAAVFNSFRRVLLSQDGRAGRANPLEGLGRWNMDLRVGKEITVTETTLVRLDFDFFNIFNNVNFNNPSLSLLSQTAFGVITSQNNNPRRIQVGLRVEF